MKSKAAKFSWHSPEGISGTAEQKEPAKTWIAIVVAAGLTLGMFFVQSCSASAKAGPNGGDVVALNDGKTSAEVLANADTGEVMVHTWANDLKSARPVEARPLMMGADEKQIQLDPQPLASDPPGYCSRFYGRADWLRGGAVHRGWLNHSGTASGRQNFEWNRGWQAGKSHGPMWSEMAGHGPGMNPGGPEECIANEIGTTPLTLARPNGQPTGCRPVGNNPQRKNMKKNPAKLVELSCHAPHAKAVFVAGTFNDWKPDTIPLHNHLPDGKWAVAIPLAWGHHEYKFVVDGQWCCEAGCEHEYSGCPKCVPNEFGTMNRVLEVS